MPRRSGTAAALLAVLALLVCAGPAAASQAGSITHSAGTVSATLEWNGDGSDALGVVYPRLAIVRDGIRYDITVDDICGTGCVLVADDAKTKPNDSILKVADLDGDGEPEVLLDTFSGGAHCCVTTRLLTWDGSTGYQPVDQDWRDYGYTLKDADGDGRLELVGHDPRFAGFFTAFAASAPALLVLQVDHGAFTDVTRRFPRQIAKDAASLRKDLRRAEKRRYDVRGLLAAYVADLYNLRRRATAKAELARQVRAHRITKKFPASLNRRLKAWGYPA